MNKLQISIIAFLWIVATTVPTHAQNKTTAPEQVSKTSPLTKLISVGVGVGKGAKKGISWGINTIGNMSKTNKILSAMGILGLSGLVTGALVKYKHTKKLKQFGLSEGLFGKISVENIVTFVEKCKRDHEFQTALHTLLQDTEWADTMNKAIEDFKKDLRGLEAGGQSFINCIPSAKSTPEDLKKLLNFFCLFHQENRWILFHIDRIEKIEKILQNLNNNINLEIIRKIREKPALKRRIDSLPNTFNISTDLKKKIGDKSKQLEQPLGQLGASDLNALNFSPQDAPNPSTKSNALTAEDKANLKLRSDVEAIKSMLEDVIKNEKCAIILFIEGIFNLDPDKLSNLKSACLKFQKIQKDMPELIGNILNKNRAAMWEALYYRDRN